MVAYYARVMSMNAVFTALADPTRRKLLDRLRVRGKSLFAWAIESLRAYVDDGARMLLVGRSQDEGVADFARTECARMGFPEPTVVSLDAPGAAPAPTPPAPGGPGKEAAPPSPTRPAPRKDKPAEGTPAPSKAPSRRQSGGAALRAHSYLRRYRSPTATNPSCHLTPSSPCRVARADSCAHVRVGGC